MKSRDKILERDAEKKEDLEIWYNQRSAQILMKPYCMEPGCGVWIPPQYYRHATSHILKKSLFPSVATHPMNFLILGASCGHHSNWDADWESAQKLGIWGEGLRRFRIFMQLIAKEEFRHLPKILLDEIEKPV